MSIGLPGKHKFALRTLVISALNASKRERKTEEANNLSMVSSYVQSARKLETTVQSSKARVHRIFSMTALKALSAH